MRHIHTKTDWAYEMRPAFMIVLGLFGILNRLPEGAFQNYLYVSQACGVILIYQAYQIIKMRRSFRKWIL